MIKYNHITPLNQTKTKCITPMTVWDFSGNCYVESNGMEHFFMFFVQILPQATRQSFVFTGYFIFPLQKLTVKQTDEHVCTQCSYL